MLEKQVDEKLCRLFKKRWPTGVCIKLATVGAHGTAGWPDRLFIAGGEVAFVELKATGAWPTALQTARLDQLRAAGVAARWFDDADLAFEWLVSVLGKP